MTIPTIREATRDDLIQFCNGKLGPSVRGIVAVLDGKIIGAGGLAFKDGVVMAFTDLSDEARPFKTMIHRTALRFLKEARKSHRRIYVEMDATEPTASRWLSRLGFREVEGVWQWQR